MALDGADPDTQYIAKVEARRRFENETQEVIRQKEAHIAALKREHLDLMKSAADHAGNLGFMYRPQTNQYVCIVSNLEDAPEWRPTPHDVEPDEHVEEDGADVQEQDETLTAREPLQDQAVPPEVQGSSEVPAEPSTPVGEVRASVSEQMPARASVEPVPFPDAEPVRPLPPVVAARASHSIEKKLHWVNALLGYLLPLLVSMFVGFGLGTLAGFNVSKPGVYLYLSLALGVAVIYGLKLLFHEKWFQYGSSVALERKPLRLRFSALTALTVLMVVLEAVLGANALIQFSLKTAFDATHSLQWAVAIPCAMAVTSPVMLLAAFSGYRMGRESVTEAEVEARRAEQIYQSDLLRYEREMNEFHRRRDEWQRVQLQHFEARAALDLKEAEECQARRIREAQQEEIRRAEAHQRELALIPEPEDAQAKWQRMESERQEMERYRKLPDYQALMQSIGRIAVLRLEISEARRELTNFKVSRGYEKNTL